MTELPPDPEYRRLPNGMRVYDLIFGMCWWTVMVAGPVLLAVSAR